MKKFEVSRCFTIIFVLLEKAYSNELNKTLRNENGLMVD